MLTQYAKSTVRGAGLVVVLSAICLALGCSGTTSNSNPIATSGQNVQPVAVNSGPAGNYVNGIFTSVTVCVPGTSNCQTIGGVLVDTGSVGLRLLSASSGGGLTLALPQETDTTGNAIAECTKFADNSFVWGSVRNADIKIGGEQASAVPVNEIGDPAFPTVPSSCSTGGTNENTLQGLGANGIIGIGVFQQDCGPGCAPGGNASPPTAAYYLCPSSGCRPAFVNLAQQVQNPVSAMPSDNNGTVIELPAVSAAGAPSVTGSLILGIGTQSNNSLSNATVFTADPNTGNFTTVFKGQSYTSSFIDSGSNGLFFLDSNTTGLPTCPSPNQKFYCPSSTRTLSATPQGVNGASENVSFSIANANNLFANPLNFVFPDLGGPNPNTFDWGLPFFFGRNVFTAIEGTNTPAGPGPYWAF